MDSWANISYLVVYLIKQGGTGIFCLGRIFSLFYLSRRVNFLFSNEQRAYRGQQILVCDIIIFCDTCKKISTIQIERKKTIIAQCPYLQYICITYLTNSSWH